MFIRRELDDAFPGFNGNRNNLRGEDSILQCLCCACLAFERKSILLRLDPAVHAALARWAADELRSTNAQIEFLLRRALGDAGRGGATGPLPTRGRPKKQPGS